MKKAGVVLVILILFSVSVIAQQYHPAEQVYPGQFKDGKYEFFRNTGAIPGTHALKVNVTGTTTQYLYGIYTSSNSLLGNALYGISTHPTGVNIGVVGKSLSTAGTGVTGYGDRYGVHGQSTITTGIGVRGWGSSTSGLNYGVYGRTDSSVGIGVYGYALDTSGNNFGVHGETRSSSGIGVYGEASSAIGGTGVWGQGRTHGIYGQGVGSSAYSGYFVGGKGVYVLGNLTVTDEINNNCVAYTSSGVNPPQMDYSCPAGKTLSSGGCECSGCSFGLWYNFPVNMTTWRCHTSGPTGTMYTHIICCG